MPSTGTPISNSAVVAVRRAGLVDAHRAAERTTGRLPRRSRRPVERDAGIHVQLAEPPRDDRVYCDPKSRTRMTDDTLVAAAAVAFTEAQGAGRSRGPRGEKRVLYRGVRVERTIWWSVRVAPQALGGHRPIGRPPRGSGRARLRARVRRRRAAGAPAPAGRAAQGRWRPGAAHRRLVLLSAPADVESRLRPAAVRPWRPTASACTLRRAAGCISSLSLATGVGLYSLPYATKLAPVVADGRLHRDGRLNHRRVEGGGRLAAVEGAASSAAFAPLARGGWVFVTLTDGAASAQACAPTPAWRSGARRSGSRRRLQVQRQ